ncbi:MAG: MucB/RseB C-terminal domain-containing protein [Pseudomonadota bacterium]
MTLAVAMGVAGPSSLSAVAAEQDPRALLAGMNDAFNSLSYDGVFSYFSGAELASLRIVHMVVDGEQHERLIHQNGAPREIVRRGEEVVCILMPGDDLLSLESSLPAGPFARSFVRRYDEISENYDLRYFGEDRIADRAAMRLAVVPLDDNRFGYRLWLDQETHLLLKSELVGTDGRPLEIFQFNTLVIGEGVDPRSLDPSGREELAKVSNFTLDSQPSVPVATDLRWSAAWLPDGFAMASTSTRRTMGDDKSVNTMMFSDGLAAFSVFIEDMPPAGAADMVSRNGATVAVTTLTKGPDAAAHLVTLVGELPTATAKRIAQSIRFQ